MMTLETTEKPATMEEIFGAPIYTATRRQALADGFQIDVTATASEAGIKFPVYMTREVWSQFVTVPEAAEGQDEQGRLWDIVWMMRVAINRSTGGPIMKFQLYVRNTARRQKLVTLKAMVGPTDFDNAAPAITIMLTEQD